MEQADFVDSFCPPATLGILKSPTANIPTRNVCWVDDRTNNGTESISLGYYGPMNVRQLYSKLKEKRFNCEIGPSIQDSNPATLKSRESPVQRNVDRRLIFITDPDRYGMAALMSTASLSQSTAVADTIYRYMAFRPYIGALVEPIGFPFFSLSFHLPFYAWSETSAENVPRDIRLDSNGNPLRRVDNASFLRGRKPQELPSSKVDSICQGQASVLIAGIDDCRWTGLCLVDTYFQPLEDRESVDTYHSWLEGGIQPDPFSEGKFEAKFPHLNPWEYFLSVLDCRARAFKAEWQILINKLRERIDQYIKKCPFMSGKTTAKKGAEFQESLIWIGQTTQLLGTLIESLKATTLHWNTFKLNEEFKTSKGLRYVSSIEETFVAASHCLALCMSDVGNQEARLQAQLAEYSQTIAYCLLYFVYPTTLAAAMLSMQEKAIPGVLGPNKRSFIILASVLTVLVFVSVTIMHRWRKIQDSIYGIVWGNGLNGFLSKLMELGGQSEDIELGVEPRSAVAAV
ncbi:hypothetical protein NM208_g3380 [Fusarium decemcellulare]|uniref:Uncharacterized protein n=1 Tax=Fusarium decemcellulare TaxID=57161 RepID=A0ACC1SP68_9HYPO|nr:hypothetical protein NM208_g3380 [Fusarium decemcellulare]